MKKTAETVTTVTNVTSGERSYRFCTSNCVCSQLRSHTWFRFCDCPTVFRPYALKPQGRQPCLAGTLQLPSDQFPYFGFFLEDQLYGDQVSTRHSGLRRLSVGSRCNISRYSTSQNRFSTHSTRGTSLEPSISPRSVSLEFFQQFND